MKGSLGYSDAKQDRRYKYIYLGHWSLVNYTVVTLYRILCRERSPGFESDEIVLEKNGGGETENIMSMIVLITLASASISHYSFLVLRAAALTCRALVMSLRLGFRLSGWDFVLFDTATQAVEEVLSSNPLSQASITHDPSLQATLRVFLRAVQSCPLGLPDRGKAQPPHDSRSDVTSIHSKPEPEEERESEGTGQAVLWTGHLRGDWSGWEFSE